MSRGKWVNIRQSNRFYIRTYRRASNFVMLSMCVNVVLGVGIYYAYSALPEPDYYSTDGVTPPVELIAMDEPNNSSQPLLANDQEQDNNNRATPQ